MGGMPSKATASTMGPRGTVPNSGSVVVDAPLKVVAEVLTDPKRKPEYEGGLEEASYLSVTGNETDVGQPSEWMVYKLYHIAAPLSKRDYVFKCNWTVDKTADGKLTATLREANAEVASKPAVKAGPVVRGWVMCTYTVTELEAGKTKLDIACNLDPMGSFPVCLAKAYGSSYPGMMLKRIAKQSRKVAKEKGQ